MSEINCYGDEEVYGEVLEGWHLVRLVNADRPYVLWSGQIMTNNSWGLTRCNDPDFCFSTDPIKEPAEDEDTVLYHQSLESWTKSLIGDISSCASLYAAMFTNGYVNGHSSYILMGLVYNYLEYKEWKPDKVWRR